MGALLESTRIKFRGNRLCRRFRMSPNAPRGSRTIEESYGSHRTPPVVAAEAEYSISSHGSAAG